MSTPARTRRRRGLSDQAAATAIEQTCRSLRLPTVRASVEEIVTAEHEQPSYRGFLAELLLAECDDRRCSARRVKAPGEVDRRLRRQPQH